MRQRAKHHQIVKLIARDGRGAILAASQLPVRLILQRIVECLQLERGWPPARS